MHTLKKKTLPPGPPNQAPRLVGRAGMGEGLTQPPGVRGPRGTSPGDELWAQL